MRLSFTKMHGLGNDFVVLDATREALQLSPQQLRFIADRHLGIGCDQILLVEAATRDGADFGYRIFNADGGEVGQCGNGARCFALFVRRRGLTDKTALRVDTLSGRLCLRVLDNDQIQVEMGVPQFGPGDIPLQAAQQQAQYTVDIDGTSLAFSAVSMGNPHAVVQVDDINTAPVKTLGPVMGTHALFPEQANIGFMQIVDRRRIKLRVFERGSGETLACGSGACAAVVCGQQLGVLDASVSVELSGGELVVSWSGPGHTVTMTGPATHVFEGTIEL
ncbi:MAG TPA: diaminopimelate epimerase [Chromatiaceae bacterium]|nr:diaminopimelate epimerase [Chromatiaceae bacterium]HIA08360.1 diaminopimelate epimerase [Chromatiaceae bacterium]HIN81594.1 diaminopimelate epimerase [Chromatiales bacterium]